MLLAGFLVACKHKKKASLSGDELVELSDFIEYFRPLKVPFTYSDTLLLKKEGDSSLISRSNFGLFIPDSLITNAYGKVNPKIYAIGKASETKKESYFLIKTIAPNKNVLFLAAFDKNQNFIKAIPVLINDNNAATSQSVTIDRRYTITKNMQLKNKDGSFSEGKDVYALNVDAKDFTLIMTDALTDKTELINPIDTLPKKNKWSADYTSGATNLVSVRDGRRVNEISFFIHFDKNNGHCTGEIKGEAKIKNATTAEYHVEGDPCILKFIFSNSSVTLQEVEGCGSKRPLECSLNGSFAKKKVVRPVMTGQKK